MPSPTTTMIPMSSSDFHAGISRTALPSNVAVFKERCVARALLVANGEMDFREAVDGLQAAADEYGLVTDIGQDAVQAIMAETFGNQMNDVDGEETTESFFDKQASLKLCDTARDKFAPEEEPSPTVPLGEWDAGDNPGPIPPRPWLLGNQFCCGFISSIVSAGGGGKSALRLLQFVSLALGRPLCDQHVFRRCRVLLVSLEDDRDELQRRIKAILDHYDIDRSELKGWLFCATPRLAKLAQMDGRTRAIGPLEQQLRGAIARCRPDLISLDPFVKTHSLEENSSGDMDFVCDLLARFAVEFNIAIDSPHHVHKGTLTPGDADSGRGSSGIRDAGRLVYTLTPMSEDEATTFGISVEDRWSHIRLDRAKVNLIERSSKPAWFRLLGVSIGNATPEYPAGDTIQVVEPWTPPDTWSDILPVTLNAVLDDIDRGLDNGQRYSNAPAATDRAVWPVVAKHCPTKTEGQCREIIHAWLRTGLLYSAEDDDPIQRRRRKGLRVDCSKRPSVTS
jgi:RecA-family ATPase